LRQSLSQAVIWLFLTEILGYNDLFILKMSQQPFTTVLVAITKHGAAQVAQLAKKLPQADVVIAEKFSAYLADVKNSTHLYSGPFRDQIANLFSNYKQIVFFCFTRRRC
jgi:hypothetical protein